MSLPSPKWLLRERVCEANMAPRDCKRCAADIRHCSQGRPPWDPRGPGLHEPNVRGCVGGADSPTAATDTAGVGANKGRSRGCRLVLGLAFPLRLGSLRCKLCLSKPAFSVVCHA